jgi:integrase
MSNRQSDHHLPSRVYYHAGKYRYRHLDGKWTTLGKEWDISAREAYDKIMQGKADAGTVSALLDAFLVERERQVRAGLAKMRTLDDNLIQAVRLRMSFGHIPVTGVTSQHVAMFLRKRSDKNGKLAPVRANREAALLSSAYSWAMGLQEWGIERNPCYGVRRNKETPRKRYIATSELAIWKRTAPKWLRAYVLLKRLTSKRQSEMLRLTRQSIQDKGLNFSIHKTDRVNIVRWSWAMRVAVNVLLSLHDPNMPNMALFIDENNSGRSMSGFKSAWARAMKSYLAGGADRESFREHDIRAKTASDLSIGRAQELLDHASPSMTQKYRRGAAKVRPLR